MKVSYDLAGVDEEAAPLEKRLSAIIIGGHYNHRLLESGDLLSLGFLRANERRANQKDPGDYERRQSSSSMTINQRSPFQPTSFPLCVLSLGI